MTDNQDVDLDLLTFSSALEMPLARPFAQLLSFNFLIS